VSQNSGISGLTKTRNYRNFGIPELTRCILQFLCGMAEESAAVCSVYGLQRTHRIVNGDDSAVFRFFVPGDLDL